MRILASVLLLLFCVPEWAGAPQLPLYGRHPDVSVKPVMLDAADPQRRTVGRLTWLGGVQLSSHDPAFGGFSSLHVTDDGAFTLLSDGGNIFGFHLDSRWQLSAPHFAELPGGPGTGWEKRDRDSESMAVDPRTGTTWVGFERANAFWRFSPGFGRVEAHGAPDAMKRWPANGGPESLALMPDGGFVTIGETDAWRHGKGRAAIRFSGDPAAHPNAGFRFSYMPPAGYNVSDATALPDGSLLVLNRSFRLPFSFTVKVTLVDAGAIKPGAMVVGREIATLAPPLIHDDFEGIAVTHEQKDTILWIVSDDNQSVLQRSLLLKFRLEPDAPKLVRR